jgi:hypothetical protein
MPQVVILFIILYLNTVHSNSSQHTCESSKAYEVKITSVKLSQADGGSMFFRKAFSRTSDLSGWKVGTAWPAPLTDTNVKLPWYC